MRKLGSRQKDLLLEALRRYTRFHKGEQLTQAWTGLGTATQYKPVHDAHLMTFVHGPNPGYLTWWRLTEEGAKIVQEWLDSGMTHEDVERSLYG